MNGGRRLNNGLLLRREFSVVVVTGSGLSSSASASDGSSVTKVVSNSSGSGVVCVASGTVLSNVADGRILLRLIDGRIELEAALLLTDNELLNAGRRAPPRADDAKIRGVTEVLDGRML